jgi:hypothetical protein
MNLSEANGARSSTAKHTSLRASKRQKRLEAQFGHEHGVYGRWIYTAR